MPKKLIALWGCCIEIAGLSRNQQRTHLFDEQIIIHGSLSVRGKIMIQMLLGRGVQSCMDHACIILLQGLHDAGTSTP